MISQFRDHGICLVTGATGFVGSHLAKALALRGIKVRGLVRNKKKADNLNLAASGVEIFEGDITNPNTLSSVLEGVNTVFHAAAVLGPSGLSHETYRKINVDGVRNMITACQSAQTVERFIYVSSVGVLGPLPPKTRADEGTPPRPQDIYEITKLEGEELVLSESETGFPAVVVRPGWVYGPGDTRTLKLFRMIAKKRFLIIGKALNKQHPVFIDDLIGGIIRSAEVLGIEGRVYHLCGSEVMTVNDLCEKVAEAAGTRLFPFRPPLLAVKGPAWLIGKLFALWGGDPPVDHRKVDFFVINRAYSIRRAKEELGWKPAVKFKNGIRQTIEWYREKGLIINKSKHKYPEK